MERRKTRTQYTAEFKARTVAPVLAGTMTSAEAANAAGVPSRLTLRWAKDAKENGAARFRFASDREVSIPTSRNLDIEALQEENELLRAALAKLVKQEPIVVLRTLGMELAH